MSKRTNVPNWLCNWPDKHTHRGRLAKRFCVECTRNYHTGVDTDICCGNCGSWADKLDVLDGYCTLCRKNSNKEK